MDFLTIKTKLAAFWAALLGIGYFFLRFSYLKKKAKSQEQVVETLKARQHVQRTKERIKRKEKEQLHSRRVEIVKELEKKDEDFKGLDNLSNPNDF